MSLDDHSLGLNLEETHNQQQQQQHHHQQTEDGDDRGGSDGSAQKKTKYGWRFWAIFTALAITALVSGLEGSLLSTALPTIVRDLETGNNYVWVINIYFLTR